MNAHARICSHCGAALTSGAPDVLTPLQAALFRELERAQGRFIHTRTLANSLWWSDPNGGPLAPKVCVSHLIRRMRAALAGTGYIIEAKHGAGYRLTVAQ